MRRRQSVSPLMEDDTHAISWDIRNPSNTHDWGPNRFYYVPASEVIVDEPKRSYITMRYGSRVQRFKPVSHVRWDVSSTGEVVEFQTGVYNRERAKGLGFVLDPNNRQDLAFWVIGQCLALCGEPTADHYRRWTAVKPSMSTRASLAVFLAELREVNKLWEVLPSHHFKVSNWKNVLRYWNSMHLNYNFGWKPFIRDIKAALEAMETFEKRLEKFVKAANRDLKRRVIDAPTIVAGVVNNIGCVNSFFRGKLTYNLNVTRGSSFDFDFAIPIYSEREMKWRAMADSLGLRATPSTIWALLPWSFVVDWFFNMSGFLQQYETDWLAPAINIAQACYTHHVYGDASFDVVTPSYPGNFLPGLELSFSKFSRAVGMPYNNGYTGELDADKIRLGGSLALSLVL